uniref:C2H2-type domain-containing protein n=1 Tax=Stomoxys calcitrans TaxID=35570 RepID=A0A1I8Q0M2_STOCA
MTQPTICRLCIKKSTEVHNLYDNREHQNEFYKIAIKFFHPMFLSLLPDGYVAAICVKCWQRIFEFHTFQESIIATQTKFMQWENKARPSTQISEQANVICGGNIDNYNSEAVVVNEAEDCPEFLAVNSATGPTEECGAIHTGSLSEGLGNAAPETFNQCIKSSPKDYGSEDTANAFNSNQYSISLPALELIDINHNNEATSNLEMTPYSDQMADIQSETQLPETSNHMEDDTQATPEVILLSSDDDGEPEEYEEPVGYFTGGDFYYDNKEPSQLGTEADNNSLSANSPFQVMENSSSLLENKADDISLNTSIAESERDLKSTRKWLLDKQCGLCLQTYESMEALQIHFQEVHPKNVFHIQCCQSKLYTEAQIEAHIQLHTNISSLNVTSRDELDLIIAQWRPHLECPECNAVYDNFKLIKQHFNESHQPFACHIRCCNQKLKHRESIKNHIQYHLNPSIHKCLTCKRTHVSKLHLYCHAIQRRHNKKGLEVDAPLGISRKQFEEIFSQWLPTVICDICNKTCSSLTQLQEHFLHKHPNDHWFIKCCQYKIKNRHHIEQHMLYHKDPDIFVCHLCGKQHITGAHLDGHMYHRHTEPNESCSNVTQKPSSISEEPIVKQWQANSECVVCHELYPGVDLLREHFHQMHPNEEFRILKCRFKLKHNKGTDDAATTSESLKTNMATLNAQTYKTDVAINAHQQSARKPISAAKSRKSFQENDLFIAQYEPMLNCALCSDKFANFASLQAHFGCEHPSEECHIVCCQRKFSLRCTIAEHISLHLDNKIFRCDLCLTCYISKNQLQRHINQFHRTADAKVLRRQLNTRKSQVRISNEEIDDFIALHWSTLSCGLCSKAVENFTQLQEHFLLDHAESQAFIECCERQLKTRFAIEEHIMLHLEAHAFKCDLCGESCASRIALYQHNQSQHPFPASGVFTQPVKNADPGKGVKKRLRLCMLRANRQNEKKADRLIAQWRSQLECDICGETCPTFTLLQNHFRQRHPQEECYVKCCQERLEHSQLLVHIRQHMPQSSTKLNPKKRRKRKELDAFIAQYERELVCVICTQTCGSFTILQNHFRRNHPDSEFFISCCGRKFKGRFHIVEHIRHHVDPNAFKCKVCGFKYTSWASFHNHMARVHSSKGNKSTAMDLKSAAELDSVVSLWLPQLQCEVCNESYQQFSLLYEHFRLQHPTQQCRIACCDRKLETRKEIENHINSHFAADSLSHSDADEGEDLDLLEPIGRKSTNHRTFKIRRRHSSLREEDKDPDYIEPKRGKSISRPNGRKTFKEYDEIIAKWKPTLECVACHETYASFSLLRKHFLANHPLEEFAIECCDRKFNNRYTMGEHVRLHLDPNAFQCSVCGKCHSGRSPLFVHIYSCHPEMDVRFSDVGYSRNTPCLETPERDI